MWRENLETSDYSLNEVDGDFYSGVNVTDDAASKISALAVFVAAALTPLLGRPPQVSVAPALRTPCATTPERGLFKRVAQCTGSTPV